MPVKAVVVIVLLACHLFLSAQDATEQNYISLTAGASIPLGDFASQRPDRLGSGMAATGFNFEMKYNHQFNELFGVATAIFYGRHAVDLPDGEHPASAIKPWTYYQILIGPMITGQVAGRTYLDVCAYTGTAFINAPKLNLDDHVVSKKYSTTAIPLKGAVDVRFLLSNKSFLFAGFSYSYLHANFNLSLPEQELSFKQRMNTVAFNGGIGFKL